MQVTMAHWFTVVREPCRSCVRDRGHGTVLGDEGKAVGCVPPTALLFVGLDVRSRRSLDDVYLAKAKGLYKRAIYPPPTV